MEAQGEEIAHLRIDAQRMNQLVGHCLLQIDQILKEIRESKGREVEALEKKVMAMTMATPPPGGPEPPSRGPGEAPWLPARPPMPVPPHRVRRAYLHRPTHDAASEPVAQTLFFDDIPARCEPLRGLGRGGAGARKPPPLHRPETATGREDRVPKEPSGASQATRGRAMSPGEPKAEAICGPSRAPQGWAEGPGGPPTKATRGRATSPGEPKAEAICGPSRTPQGWAEGPGVPRTRGIGGPSHATPRGGGQTAVPVGRDCPTGGRDAHGANPRGRSPPPPAHLESSSPWESAWEDPPYPSRRTDPEPFGPWDHDCDGDQDHQEWRRPRASSHSPIPAVEPARRVEVCNLEMPERIPIAAYGGSRSSDFLGSPTESGSEYSRSTRRSAAHVNVVGHEGDMAVVSHPLMSAALKASEVRKFSGKCEDFEEFARQWEGYLKIMYGGSGKPLAEHAVLVVLRKHLDKASATNMDAELSVDPNLSYYTFWERFKSRFMRDVRAARRQSWQTVKLRKAGKLPTLQEWQEFAAAYRSKPVLVEDWNDSENYQQVLSQVVPEHQEKVVTELARRRRGQWLARVTYPDGLDGHELLDEFGKKLGRRLTATTWERRHFVVRCQSEGERRIMTAMDGAKLWGKAIKIHSAEFQMSGDDVLDYVTQLLEQDDELRLFRRSIGQPETTETARTPKEAAGTIFTVAEAGKERDKSPAKATPSDAARGTKGGNTNYNPSGNKGGKGKGRGQNVQWDHQAPVGKGKGKGYSGGYGKGWSEEWNIPWNSGYGKGRGAPQPPPAAPVPGGSEHFCYACALDGKVPRHDPSRCQIFKRYREFRASWDAAQPAQASGQGGEPPAAEPVRP